MGIVIIVQVFPKISRRVGGAPCGTQEIILSSSAWIIVAGNKLGQKKPGMLKQAEKIPILGENYQSCELVSYLCLEILWVAY